MIRTRNNVIMRGFSLFLPEDLHAKALELKVNMAEASREGIRRAVSSAKEHQKNETAADGGATTTTKSLPRRPVSRTNTSE